MTDIQKINDWIILEEQAKSEKEKDPNDPKPPVSPPGKTAETPQTTDSSENKGQLLLDATCAPADIAYPTDISLLNQCREKLEAIIDCLYTSVRQAFPRKPKTYRSKAHSAYLAFAKQRQPSRSRRRKAVGQQLRLVARDLRHVEKLKAKAALTRLPSALYRALLIVSEVYRQQQEVFATHSHTIAHRIVSL
ncbi:MAG: hypothetical protein ABF608_03970 [Sporolactobacillus sp.]